MPGWPPESPESPLDDRQPGRLEARVTGRVQGVGYRVYAARAGWRLGLVGWVRNDADGAVTVVAEGDRADLESLLEALWGGPAGAEVSDVRATWSPTTGRLHGFEIRAGHHGGD